MHGKPSSRSPSKCSWVTVPPELLWKSLSSQPLLTDVGVLAPYQGLELKEPKSEGSRVVSTVSPKQAASGLRFGSILWVCARVRVSCAVSFPLEVPGATAVSQIGCVGFPSVGAHTPLFQ